MKTICIVRLSLVLFLLLNYTFLLGQEAINSNPKSLLDTFSWDASKRPMYSAHRGGPQVGFPENCLATLENSYEIGVEIMEIDVGMTKDSVLVLLHDSTLDRTTTGIGLLTEKTYKEIEGLTLKDNLGNVTSYKIPLLDSVLVWARSKTILCLDVKGGIPFSKVIDAVRKYEVSHSTMIIAYSIQDLKRIYKLAPDLLISATIRNEQELDSIINTNIPFNNIIAFTGTKAAEANFYKRIHQLGSFCILGTMGGIDNLAKEKGIEVYHHYLRKGVDILTGDLPQLTIDALKSYEK